MHPRNPYQQPPDFAALAVVCPALAPYLCHTAPGRRAQLDWSHPQALVELCRALLLRDFGVSWTLPPGTWPRMSTRSMSRTISSVCLVWPRLAGSLCPTIPSRLNYLLWIADLLALRSEPAGKEADAVVGIDVGTGASCIYPLLGVAHFGWRFIATELDEHSVRAARSNVAQNGWEDRIDVREVRRRSLSCGGRKEVGPEPPILVGVLGPAERADFCMCNPPFFDIDETPSPNWATRPEARCDATVGEQFTAGGEVGFVQRMVTDSLAIGTRLRWCISEAHTRRPSPSACVPTYCHPPLARADTCLCVRVCVRVRAFVWACVPQVHVARRSESLARPDTHVDPSGRRRARPHDRARSRAHVEVGSRLVVHARRGASYARPGETERSRLRGGRRRVARTSPAGCRLPPCERGEH